jgi:hypothetical protein
MYKEKNMETTSLDRAAEQAAETVPSAATLAIAVLTEAAARDPDYIRELFIQARRGNPEGVKALLKAAGLETLGDTRPAQKPEEDAKSNARPANPRPANSGCEFR